MPTPSIYANIARLCEMYANAYKVYAAGARPPKMDRATKLAAQELDELMLALEKAISPVTFQQMLESASEDPQIPQGDIDA